MQTLRRFRSRLALAALAAFAVGGLCSCGNDPPASQSPSGDGDDDDDDAGTYTVSGALTASGGQCSCLSTAVGEGNTDIQLVITCFDAPEPIVNLVFDMPFPPTVGTYTAITSADAIAFAKDDSVNTVTNGTQSLTVNLTAVDDPTTTINIHGNIAATFLVTAADGGTAPLDFAATF